MRTIKRTAKFKKDYKREAKGPHRATLDKDLVADLILIYSLPDEHTLTLVRLGSHSELSF